MKTQNYKFKRGINNLELHNNEQFSQMRTSPGSCLKPFYITKAPNLVLFSAQNGFSSTF